MANSQKKMDKEQAFELFYNAPNDRIMLNKVAEHFGVRYDYVRRIAGEGKWRDRAHERDRAVRAETEKKMVKSHAERVIDNLKIIDALKGKFARQLVPKSTYEIESMSVREYFEMVKLELLLTGNPTNISASEAKARQLDEIEAEINELDDMTLMEELRINGLAISVEGGEVVVPGDDVDSESEGTAEAPEATA